MTKLRMIMIMKKSAVFTYLHPGLLLEPWWDLGQNIEFAVDHTHHNGYDQVY